MELKLEVKLSQDGDPLFSDEIYLGNADLDTLKPIVNRACEVLHCKLMKDIEKL